MNRQRKILELIDEINSILVQEQPHYYPGLLNGNAGVILFMMNYYLYIDSNKITFDKINELLQKLLYQINTLPIDKSLGNGYAGIYWVCRNLLNNKMLSEDSKHELDKLLDTVTDSISDDIKISNFDYHFGFTGKYLLLEGVAIEKYMLQIQNWIGCDISDNDNIIESIKTEDNEINLGLAHGLPSLLLFLYKQGFLSMNHLEYFIDLFYLIYNKRLNQDVLSVFPNSQNINNLKNNKVETETISRYAWCYGDLGIFYALASINEYSHPKLIAIKKELSIRCNQRDLQNGLVNYFDKYKCYDPGFCHGIAGIFHLQKKVNLLLSADDMIITNEYWLDLLIQNTKQLLSQLPQKGYQNDNYEDMLNISTGIAGIGLVLLSEISKDNEWDFCFMLNN